jgi:hypothetical protein
MTTDEQAAAAFATYPETLVARVLGLPKKSVAAARHRAGLERPGDWVLENSCVAFTPAGVSRICAALGLAGVSVGRIMAARAQGGAPDADEGQESGPEETEGSAGTESGAEGRTGKISEAVRDEVAAAQATAAAPVTIEVDRLSPNTRILHGKLAGAPVTVVVRDNRNFRRGMVLKADPVNERVFRMLGRCPRWPGRW